MVRVFTFLEVIIISAVLIIPSFLSMGFSQPTFITSDSAINAAKQFKGWSPTQLASYGVFTELRYLKEEEGWLIIYTVDPATGKILQLEQSLLLTIPDPVVKLRGYYWFASINTNVSAPRGQVGAYSNLFWVNAINAAIAYYQPPGFGDWQLGWKTSASYNGKGINAKLTSNQVFLKEGDIMIIEGFTDDQGYWCNIGFWNSSQADMSGYKGTPPCDYEEVCQPGGTQVARYVLADGGGYGGTAQLSIIYDLTRTPNRWGWFFAQGLLSTYNTGGNKINANGSICMIEKLSGPQGRSPEYPATLFTDGLQYCNSAYNGQFPGMTNPLSQTITEHDNGQPNWFTTTKSYSSSWSLTFKWST